MSDYSKKIYAVYLEAALGMPNTMIGQIAGLYRHTVSHWVKLYQNQGFESLCRFNYGSNKSEMESYSKSILEFLAHRPPMNACKAKSRIEEMTGISRSFSQVRQFMKGHGLGYLKTGHAKYCESPTEFHQSITGFFRTVNQKYAIYLSKLLTLKFQFFQNKNVLINPV